MQKNVAKRLAQTLRSIRHVSRNYFGWLVVICPQCGIDVETSSSLCPQCGFNLWLLKDETCEHCWIGLDARPVICIENASINGNYCYACAKKIVAETEGTLRATAEAEYSEKLNLWQKNNYPHSQWEEKRRKFVRDRRVARTIFVVGISIGLVALGGWPLSILILFYFFMFFFRPSQGDTTAFRIAFPEPSGPGDLPVIDKPKVKHHLVRLRDCSEMRFTRTQILERDRQTCQWCGASAPGTVFEVHHVIPRGYGGDDSPDNLVTLCVECHRKEDWYGHVHKYATKRMRTRKRWS